RAASLRRNHPDFALGYWVSGLAAEQQGRYAEAESHFRKCLELSPRDGRATPALGHLLGLMGRRAEALAVAEEIQARVNGEGRGLLTIGLVYIGLGENAKALEWLEHAYAQRDHSLPYIKLDPRWDPGRKDPHFITLLRRLS